METTRIKELIIKKISGTGSQEDLLELEALLHNFPAYKVLDDVLTNTTAATEGTPGERDVQTQLDTLWQRIDQHKANGRRRIEGRWFLRIGWLAAAAVFVALLSVGIMEYRKDHAPQIEKFHSITADYGRTSAVVLPDGSTVKLNSGTTLTYPVEFDQNLREVKLVGEAFFDVTHDPVRPFLVHADNLTVRVLGTVFNVKAYKEDSNVETTLIEGKVQVLMDNEPDKFVTLSPNEKLTVAKHSGNSKTQALRGELNLKVQPIKVKPSEDIEEIAWLDHKLAFSNASFGDVARMIERKYNVRMVFQQERLKSELITGVFENEPLSKALNLLQMSTHFNYEIKKDTVILNTSEKIRF